MELEAKQKSKDRNQIIQSNRNFKRKSPFVHQKIISSDDSDDRAKKSQQEKKKLLQLKNESNQKNTIIDKKLNSVQISKLLINKQGKTVPSIQQASSYLMRIRQIKSMKFENFTKNIKSQLQELSFQQSFLRFKRIIQSIDQKNCTIPQSNSIFNGFQLSWKQLNLQKQDFLKFLYPFYHKIPNNLNKKYAQFLSQKLKSHQDKTIYKQVRTQIMIWIENQIGENVKNIRNNKNSQKLIPLYQFFDLENQISHQRLSKSIPKQKLTDYLVVNNQRNNNQSQKNYDLNQKNINLIYSSINRLVDENNLKEAQKIIKKFNLPIKDFPNMIKKMEQKYLQYLYRQNKIYFVDLIIKSRPSVIRLLVQLLRKKNKTDDMLHFIHKYKLFDMLGNGKTIIRDVSKIYANPLIVQDAFGPTQSVVLGEKKSFLILKDFKIYQKDVVFINWQTILKKQLSQSLQKLRNCKSIGLDSQKSAGIHPFDKAKLQIVQVFCQDNNKVYIFDIKSFQKGQKMKKMMESNKKLHQQNLDKAVIQIDFQGQQTQKSESEWDYFLNLMKILLTEKTVYGHCLHSDIPQIFQTLQIKCPNNSKLQIIDSQAIFKQAYPKQTKSNLNYLCEFLFGKPISKYQQCSAWDYRPLRRSQIHYAALDAVLPLKLVNKMRKQTNN